MKEKNGKIELLRFIFAIAILLRHINLKVFNLDATIGPFSLSKLGYIGVEFFFLVSGYLMAMNIYKHKDEECTNLGVGTAKYIFRKIKAIFPYHLIACIAMAIILWVGSKQIVPWKVIPRLPSILFVQTTGILGSESPLIAMEWYLSAMFLGMFILYPLCRKNYQKFIYWIAPLIVVLVLGYLNKATGFLSGSSTYMSFTYKCNFRAIGELALGMICFEVARHLKDLQLSKFKKIMLIVFENLCYIFVGIVMFSNLSSSYEMICLILLACAITITFGLFGNRYKMYNNKFTYFLGNISLPIYLVQEVVWVFVLKGLPIESTNLQALLIFALSIVSALVLYCVVTTYKKIKLKN